MSKIILEVEDSAVEKVLWFLEQLNDVVTIDMSMIERDLSNDPLALELQKRIQEIDDGAVELIPHSEVMNRIYAKWEQKCM
jgi:hypothetical protein